MKYALSFLIFKRLSILFHMYHLCRWLIRSGLDASTTCWLNNYHADRTQAVIVNGAESSVRSGVPQGSVLGPLLFLIYIDDLPASVADLCSKLNLFADDVLLYHIIAQAADYAALQLAISLIEHWSNTNFLDFNISNASIWSSLGNSLPLYRLPN